MTRWPKKCQPLPWYGGKQGAGKAEWISGMLPWRKNSVYLEPFGGMASVLLTRAPVRVEVLNDLDERVINWWRVVRDHPDRFGEMVQATPHSRREHEWACASVNDLSLPDITRALAFHILASQTVMQNLNRKRIHWSIRTEVSGGTSGRWRSERVGILAERMWGVQLECVLAEELIKRVVDNKDAVIYCDPPYPTADTSPYVVCDVDKDGLSDLLCACQGQVMISGQGKEWDHLGWERHERTGLRPAKPLEKKARMVTEVVWTNFVVRKEFVGGLFSLENDMVNTQDAGLNG